MRISSFSLSMLYAMVEKNGNRLTSMIRTSMNCEVGERPGAKL